jgi:hypothetical protein
VEQGSNVIFCKVPILAKTNKISCVVKQKGVLEVYSSREAQTCTFVGWDMCSEEHKLEFKINMGIHRNTHKCKHIKHI